MTDVMDRIEGVAIGLLIGLEAGVPMVALADNPRDHVMARSLTVLDDGMIGSEVALLFEGGDPRRPIVIGPLLGPLGAVRSPAVSLEGEPVKVIATGRIELRCGKASIILEEDGQITIRGTHLNSQASGANHIRGASVHLN